MREHRRPGPKKIVDQLVDSAMVKDFADLYHLDLREIGAALRGGMGEKIGGRICWRRSEASKEERSCTAASMGLVCALSANARSIDWPSHFGSMEALEEASEEELTQVTEVGPKVAASIVEFFSERANRKVIERLRAAGRRSEAGAAGAALDALGGEVVCLYEGRWRAGRGKRLGPRLPRMVEKSRTR